MQDADHVRKLLLPPLVTCKPTARNTKSHTHTHTQGAINVYCEAWVDDQAGGLDRTEQVSPNDNMVGAVQWGRGGGGGGGGVIMS